MHARALWQLTTKLHVQYKIWHDVLIAWTLLALREKLLVVVQRMFPLNALLTATFTGECIIAILMPVTYTALQNVSDVDSVHNTSNCMIYTL